MLKINQIPDKPGTIKIEKNGNFFHTGSIYYARNYGNIVAIINQETGNREFDSHFSELYINDLPASSAGEAVIELNSFIGLGFNQGGDVSLTNATLTVICDSGEEYDFRLKLLEERTPQPYGYYGFGIIGEI